MNIDFWPSGIHGLACKKLLCYLQCPLRESIPRLFNGGKTIMTTRCAPACSQALPVKPQGVWARGIEAWLGSRDLRNLEFRRWGSSGPSSLMSMKFVSSGQIDNKSILVQLMAWCLTASRQNLKSVISEHMSWISFMITSCEIALRWMQQNTFDDKSTSVQVMAWCCQAPSHYMSQCWHSSMSPCGITRPQ